VRGCAEAARRTVRELGARPQDADQSPLIVPKRVAGVEAVRTGDQDDRGLVAGVEPSGARGNEVLAGPDRRVEACGGARSLVAILNCDRRPVRDHGKDDRQEDDSGRANDPSLPRPERVTRDAVVCHRREGSGLLPVLCRAERSSESMLSPPTQVTLATPRTCDAAET